MSAEPADNEPSCLNCGTPLSGAYCHACGQRAASPVGPLREVLSEVLDGVFSLDNRLVRTVVQLLRHPGALSVAYLSGRRAQYLQPVRLYLTLSLAYFLLAQFLDTVDLLFVTSTSEGRMAEFLPRILFFVVPAAAALQWLMYRGSRPLYVEHLVAALHLHSGWFVLFSATLVIGQAIPAPEQIPESGPLVWLLAAVVAVVRVSIPIYTFLLFRRLYTESRARTAGKVFLFFIGYMVLLGAALFALMKVLY